MKIDSTTEDEEMRKRTTTSKKEDASKSVSNSVEMVDLLPNEERSDDTGPSERRKGSAKKKQTKNRGKEPYIGDYHEAPEYLQSNQYLLTGYRINYDSWGKLARTIFMLHNETVNMWSHGLAALFFICLGIYVFLYQAPASFYDKSVFLRWFTDFDAGSFTHLQCDVM